MIDKFIENFRNKNQCLVDIFTNGCCYHFACILNNIFSGFICYNDIDNHFAFMSNEGKLYDITGQISDDKYESWTLYKVKEPLNSSRIVKNCIYLNFEDL